MIPTFMTILAVLFIMYLTYDTEKRAKGVINDKNAFVEEIELIQVFRVIWYIIAAFGLLVVLGVFNPASWIAFL